VAPVRARRMRSSKELEDFRNWESSKCRRGETAKGLAALREYAAHPAVFTPFKSDMLLRVLLADLVGEEPTRAAITALRSEIAELEAQLDRAKESAARLPHREKYLLLVIDFLNGLLELHLDWIGAVERELAVDSQDVTERRSTG